MPTGPSRRLLLLLSCALWLTVVAGRPSAAAEPRTAADFYRRGQGLECRKKYKEALEDYSKALELDSGLASAWWSRSFVQERLHRYSEAIADLTRYLEFYPGDYPALFNRGLYHQLAGHDDAALADFSDILDGDVDFAHAVGSPDESLARAYHYRGRIYQERRHDPAPAVADYSAAIEHDPTVAVVWYRRARAFHDLQEFGSAEEDFQTALQMQPDDANLLCAWAWQLATCSRPTYRDGSRALQLALQGTGQGAAEVPRHLETLAAAYAETGQFDDAVKWQTRALELAPPGDSAARKDMQDRLELFRGRLPYREP